MTSTEKFIEQLAARAKPVRPLAPAWQRACTWLLVSAGVIALLTSVFGLRPQLFELMLQPAPAMEWVGSLLTGVLAAFAVFQISVPGRSLKWAWLPVPALLLWTWGVGLGCLGEWLHMGNAWFAYQPKSLHCAREVALVSLPIGIILLVMVRHAAFARPRPTALLGGLAAAALSSAGVSLFHVGETAVMGLVGHFVAVLVLVLSCTVFNRRLFGWVGAGRPLL
jgi:hypothetical protein